MNVVFFTPSAHGGHPRYTKEVIDALASIDGSCINYGWLTSKDLTSDFLVGKYVVFNILPVLKDRKSFSNTLVWFLNRIFHYPTREFMALLWVWKNKPDVIHFQEISPYIGFFTLFFLKYLLKVRVVYTNHNVVPHSYPKLFPKFLIDFLAKGVTRLCDRIVVHSEKLKLILCERNKVEPSKVVVAPHGVWTNFFEKTKEKKDSRTNLLFYGSIRRNKGLHYLLDVMPLLGSDFSLKIAGYCADSAYLKESIEPRIDRIKLEGGGINFDNRFIPDSEVSKLFSWADFLVLPYKDFEAQSGILFDAIQYETPIVCSNSGALAETVIKYKIGHVFSSYEPLAIAETITAASADTLSNCNYDFSVIKSEMSWINHARILNKMYLGLEI